MLLQIFYTVPDDYQQLWLRWTRRFRETSQANSSTTCAKASCEGDPNTHVEAVQDFNPNARAKALYVADTLIVVLFVCLYLVMGLLTLATPSGSAVLVYLASTAVCFVLLSVVRTGIDAPRPYELFDLVPLVPKDNPTQGKSLPSRHVFSAFLIATIAVALMPTVGVVAFVLAAVLAVLRVLEGVHFPRDVLAGAVLGVVAGLLCLAAMGAL